MSTQANCRRPSQRGFSLLEMLTVLAILTLVMGVVFKQIITVQQRYRGEEAKLDIAQESREFLDLMVRDMHQAGYPTLNMYGSGAVLATPAMNDQRVAAGLVNYAYNDIWLEGDVDGDGQVEVVEYKLFAGPGGACPCTIQRRQQTPKMAGDPLTQLGSTFVSELQDVVNSGGSGGAKTNQSLGISGTGPGGHTNEVLYGALEGPYIFQAFDARGNPLSPADISTVAGQTTLRNIRSIKITINVLAKPSASDLQTGRRSAVSMTATARIPNPPSY